ncbi:flagellar biosynthesis protein FlgJ [Aminobacter sp. DSM 101952]|uniref:rod-binding protein n=1 Tax=Aminobacter sp. DSM 101952 TaxID=2735891 RepID=UPI0006F489CE|nr:rod-binding protein [Aminobacter sp. DSM 101952]KQU64798.1 flagellar biosynthesis protein FlgJ [Aminobacter sp. DSM 101952]
MAISPPSDIVLDVAKAVEPAGIQAARAALANRTASTAGAFSLTEAAVTGGISRQPDTASPDASMKRFEAMVLQTFIENMLPKNTDSVYGKGMAGDMWKSMMAEHLAGQTAEAGGIGIAKALMRDHYIKDEQAMPVGPAGGGPDRAALDQQESQATAVIQEIQRKMVQSLGRDTASSVTDTKS